MAFELFSGYPFVQLEEGYFDFCKRIELILQHLILECGFSAILWDPFVQFEEGLILFWCLFCILSALIMHVLMVVLGVKSV